MVEPIVSMCFCGDGIALQFQHATQLGCGDSCERLATTAFVVSPDDEDLSDFQMVPAPSPELQGREVKAACTRATPLNRCE